MNELPQVLPGLAAALGLGMLIGIERERRKSRAGQRAAAGVRTHSLLALVGAVAALLGPWALAIGGVGVVALALASYLRSPADEQGLTGEIAILLTYLLGALAHSEPLLAAGVGVAVAVLLASKGALHRLTRDLITEQEMRDLLLLAAAVLIVLPLLPEQAIDPWGVLKPASLGKLVVMVMGIGAAGHVALRLIGARWGLPVAGFFAGFASSTAATAGFGQRARETPALRTHAVAAALFANLASLILFIAIIAAAAPTLFAATRLALLAGGIVLALGGALGLRHASRDPAALPHAPQARAFRLSHALIFAAVVAVVLLVSAWLQRQFGDAGALTAATFAALAELHAAAASLAQLVASEGLGVARARWGVAALLAASVIAKILVAISSGGVAYGVRVGAGLLAMLAAVGATLVLIPIETPPP